MKWRGQIKPVYIDLPEDLHTAMKATAPVRKTTMREAYISAATAWLDGLESIESVDFGAISQREKTLLNAALEILRTKPRFVHSILTETLDGWIEQQQHRSDQAKAEETVDEGKPRKHRRVV